MFPQRPRSIRVHCSTQDDLWGVWTATPTSTNGQATARVALTNDKEITKSCVLTTNGVHVSHSGQIMRRWHIRGGTTPSPFCVLWERPRQLASPVPGIGCRPARPKRLKRCPEHSTQSRSCQRRAQKATQEWPVSPCWPRCATEATSRERTLSQWTRVQNAQKWKDTASVNGQVETRDVEKLKSPCATQTAAFERRHTKAGKARQKYLSFCF